MAKTQEEYLRAAAGATASNDGRGEFLQHGEYVLEHESLKFNPTAFHGANFCAVLKVLEAMPIGDSKPNPVGSTVAIIFKPDELYGLKNMKAMLCGTFGEDPEDVSNINEMAAAFGLATGPTQALKGVKVRVKTYTKTSQKGVHLVLPTWIQHESTKTATPAAA